MRHAATWAKVHEQVSSDACARCAKLAKFVTTNAADRGLSIGALEVFGRPSAKVARAKVAVNNENSCRMVA